MLPDKATEPPAIPEGHHSVEAAHAVFAATAQMGLALRESQGPVAELGSLCAQFSESLAALRSASGAQGVPDPQLLARLQADVFEAVQQLQFYDRMVQHLTHIQEYLIAVANELGAVTDAPAPGVWDEMHARLRKRLISDAQRGLLDLFLSPETTTHVSAQAPRADYSPPGSVEMF